MLPVNAYNASRKRYRSIISLLNPGRIGAMPVLRRFLLFFTLILILLASISGCSKPAAPSAGLTPTQTALRAAIAEELSATIIPSPSATISPTKTPTAAPVQSPHYTLEAVLDYEQHQLQVAEKIHYINNSTDRLSELLLMVDPLYFPGTFKLDSLNWEDGQPVENIVTETGWLRFPLRQPLEPGQALDLSVAYQLNLPSPVPNAATRPIPFGYTSRQTNLVDWYPFVPPYISGQGWLAHPAGYYGEHLVYDIADFTVNIRMNNPHPELIVAASAPGKKDGDWYRFEHDSARNFAWSVSPYYQVLTGQTGPVKVTSYAFGGEEKANRAVLDTTLAAVELYSRLFGAYPRQELSVVEADFLDGMEYDGLYFLSKGFYNLYTGTPAEYLVAIAAHETAHQWWYALVGNDQALEPWLDEALATYSERLYYENLHPEALDWWWNYRVNYYQPRGWIDDTIYNPHGEVEAYRAYREAVYLNGAKFLEELRQSIGDQAFFDFLKDYASQYQKRLATSKDFFSLLKQYSSTDLTSLLKKYFNKL